MKRMYQVEVDKHVRESYEVEATSQDHAEELISKLDFYNLDAINGKYVDHCRFEHVESDILDLEIMVDGYMEVE